MDKLRKFFFSDQSPSRLILIGNLLLIFFIIAPICIWIFHKQTYHWNTVWGYKEVLFKGWLVTIGISLVSFALSCVIGLICALAKHSEIRVIRILAKIYIELIYGIPLLAQILFFFYVVANPIGIQNIYIMGIIVLAFFSGAYVAEIYREGMEKISPSQWESAKILGFSKVQTYRFIILPQAIKLTLPAIVGRFAFVIKDSSLLVIIGVNDFTFCAQEVNSATSGAAGSYLVLVLGYLLLTFPISLWSKYLEKRLRYET